MNYLNIANFRKKQIESTIKRGLRPHEVALLKESARRPKPIVVEDVETPNDQP